MEEKPNAADSLVANGAEKASDEQHAEAKEKLASPNKDAHMKPPKTIPFPSCRLVLSIMGFFGMVNCYTLRVNLSIGIIHMVNQTFLHEIELQRIAAENGTGQTHTTCPVPEVNETGNATETMEGYFNWDETTQGHILGAFFYGYTTTQILGGTLAQKIGGKVLMLFGVVWTAVLTLLTPPVTKAGGFPAIFILRFLEGMGEAVTYPSMASMLSKWAPPLERSKMTTFIYAGGQIGTVVGLPLCGLLCDWFGWESVFYFFGALGVFWGIIWFFTTYDSPSVHPRINPDERDYIERSLGHKGGVKKTLHVPWLSIFKSVPVYALMVSHFTCNIGYYTLLTQLPKYFKHILHFDVKSNGLLSGAPFLFMWIFLVLSGYLADVVRAKGWLSTTNVRKVMNAVGFILPAILMVATGYVGCHAALAVTVLFTAIGLSGISFAGWSCNHLDLAPPYAGSLMGLTNTIATFPGFIGPAVVGVITDGNQTIEAWRLVFYLGAGVYVFGTVIYLIFGSGEVQPWGYPPKTEEMKSLDDADKEEKEKMKNPDEKEKEVV